MGTDCVAPLLFSQLLLAKLQAAVHAQSSSSAAVRVVWASSLLVEMAAPKGGIDFTTIDRGLNDGVAQYSQAKVGNWFLAHEWARRYGQGSEAVLSVTQNPGNLRTDAFKDTPGLWMKMIGWTLRPPKLGAYTLLYAGLSPEVTVENNGGYIIPWGRIYRVNRKDINHALTPVEEGGLGAGKKLWD
jgi:NAD(P)-dependent dehydrogenase (short-subunit alcohol dehydrogenase family)